MPKRPHTWTRWAPGAVMVLIGAAVAVVAARTEMMRPVAVFETDGRYVPARWARHFNTTETIAEIERDLGPPQISATAKGFERWVVRYPWGEKTLTVIGHYPDRSQRPGLIIYSIALKDRPMAGLGQAEIYNTVAGGTEEPAGHRFRVYPGITGALVVTAPRAEGG